MMLAPTFSSHKNEVPIVKTVASEQRGLDELYHAINKHQREESENERRSQLLAERVYFLIQQKRMQGVNKHDIRAAIDAKMKATDFNLYRFVEEFK